MRDKGPGPMEKKEERYIHLQAQRLATLALHVPHPVAPNLTVSSGSKECAPLNNKQF